LCVRSLEEPKACNLTFEVKEAEDSQNPDWESLFSSLQSDRIAAIKS
ncbi:hypothetical protein H6F50_23995, partial [Coleofasciculus sp. FACHB-712]|nr:hypothetical protein [Coleofasciculus sp. FACHB-712]